MTEENEVSGASASTPPTAAFVPAASSPKGLDQRLQSAGEGDRLLDGAIARALGFYATIVSTYNEDPHVIMGKGIKGVKSLPYYTTSIDAAMTLVPDGWTSVRPHWHRMNDGSIRAYAEVEIAGRIYESDRCTTPPLALCIAALKARNIL